MGLMCFGLALTFFACILRVQFKVVLMLFFKVVFTLEKLATLETRSSAARRQRLCAACRKRSAAKGRGHAAARASGEAFGALIVAIDVPITALRAARAPPIRELFAKRNSVYRIAPRQRRQRSRHAQRDVPGALIPVNILARCVHIAAVIAKAALVLKKGDGSDLLGFAKKLENCWKYRF